MNILVFDTETTALQKCFCYDLGYVVLDTDSLELVERKHFVVEQVWHNLPLFESAYYKDKRPLYVELMRKRAAKLDKWGYVMRELRNDIKKYNITDAYAYNSDFDIKVFDFNCDWFKTNNPLENMAVHDIWGYASAFITNQDEYTTFCEEHERFTDTGNYKGSAEVVYQYITHDVDFIEEHMGLYDSMIEAGILVRCISLGAEYNTDYAVRKILPRVIPHDYVIKINNKVVYKGQYIKKYVRNDTYSFTEM